MQAKPTISCYNTRVSSQEECHESCVCADMTVQQSVPAWSGAAAPAAQMPHGSSWEPGAAPRLRGTEPSHCTDPLVQTQTCSQQHRPSCSARQGPGWGCVCVGAPGASGAFLHFLLLHLQPQSSSSLAFPRLLDAAWLYFPSNKYHNHQITVYPPLRDWI